MGGARDLNEEGADGLAVGERAGVFGRDGGDVPGAVRGAERAVRGGSAGGPAEGFGVLPPYGKRFPIHRIAHIVALELQLPHGW